MLVGKKMYKKKKKKLGEHLNLGSKKKMRKKTFEKGIGKI